MKNRPHQTLGLLAAPALLLVGGLGYALWPSEVQQIETTPEVLIGAAGFSLEGSDLQDVESFELNFGAFRGESSSRELRIQGNGFYGTALGPWVRTSEGVELGHWIASENELVVILPDSLSGPQTLEVELSDGRTATLETSL